MRQDHGGRDVQARAAAGGCGARGRCGAPRGAAVSAATHSDGARPAEHAPSWIARHDAAQRLLSRRERAEQAHEAAVDALTDYTARPDFDRERAAALAAEVRLRERDHLQVRLAVQRAAASLDDADDHPRQAVTWPRLRALD